MATATGVEIPIRTDRNAHAIAWQWTLTTTNNVGDAKEWSAGRDRSIQIAGTPATAHVKLEGSNDGTNWSPLNDPQGVAIDMTAAGIKAVQEFTRYIRPTISSGGDGTTSLLVTVIMGG